MAVGGYDQPAPQLTRSTTTVDEQGWGGLATELDALQQHIHAIEAGSDVRLAHEQHHIERRSIPPPSCSCYSTPPPATPHGVGTRADSAEIRREQAGSGSRHLSYAFDGFRARLSAS